MRVPCSQPRSLPLRPLIAFLSLVCAIGLGCTGDDGDDGDPGPSGPAGPAGPPGPPGDPLDPSTSVEGCIGCHAVNAAVPVADITNLGDAHYVDTDPFGPLTGAGYRQLDVVLATVDVTGSSIVIDFDVSDVTSMGSAPVDDILASDGRFTLARLVAGAAMGDPRAWERIVNGERFTSGGALFENLGAGAYRYTSVFDPASEPIIQDETLRLGMQIAASDLPADNGWCDFDADLAATNVCDPPMVSITRDIVQTATCNGCHGVTSDVRLDFHSGRTEVEYCVTCHNPDIGETDFTPLIHKIHAGAMLANGFRGYSNVDYTRDLDDCTTCHSGGGADVDSWFNEPNRVSCGSCHDEVDFDTGANHGLGGTQPDNSACAGCHPPAGAVTTILRPVQTVHLGVVRNSEGGRYRGTPNGFSIDLASWDPAMGQITVDYSVTRDGAKAMLESDPEWLSSASSLSIKLGWPTREYTNEGSGSSAPAQPPSFDALPSGGLAMALGSGDYRLIIDVPSSAFGTTTVDLEGRPAADLDGDSAFGDRIAVRSDFEHVNIEPRAAFEARRQVIDIDKCNACHDSAGSGLSLHSNNRTSEMQVCVVCHNNDATDIVGRPADPSTTPDGKREETIDIKRMIHQIHAGADLEQGYVVYGSGGGVHDFSTVSFLGNNDNCETCHLPGSYSTEAAAAASPSTIDTSADVMDPSDDLNISPIAAVCSSCHDDAFAIDHMLLNGASFRALDEDIH